MSESLVARLSAVSPEATVSPSRTASSAGVRVEGLTFAEVYDEHFDYVYRLIVRLAGSADHEDLVQEVFAVVHARLHTFEGRARITTWLFQIAYRVVGAHIRRERVRRFARRALALEREGDHVPADAPDRIDEAKRTRALARAIDGLSLKKRSVLVLFELEGWSCGDIAETMGIPIDTVYTRLHHARVELARAVMIELAEGRR